MSSSSSDVESTKDKALDMVRRTIYMMDAAIKLVFRSSRRMQRSKHRSCIDLNRAAAHDRLTQDYFLAIFMSTFRSTFIEGNTAVPAR